MIEERHQDSHQASDEDAVNPYMFAMENIEKTRQGNEGQAGREAVDAINQIDSIHDKDQYSNGDHHSHECWYLIDAQETIEVIDVKIGHRQQTGNHYLYKKFDLSPHTKDVVQDTCYVNNRDTHAKEDTPRADPNLTPLTRIDPRQQGHECSHQHTRHERDAP